MNFASCFGSYELASRRGSDNQVHALASPHAKTSQYRTVVLLVYGYNLRVNPEVGNPRAINLWIVHGEESHDNLNYTRQSTGGFSMVGGCP